METVLFQEAYEKFFDLPRESVYLHLNKTNFLKGESIWFSGYVQERKTELPSLKSTTLYVFLYDQQDILVDRQILYVTNGTTQGQFSVSKDIAAGNYYLKAYTNWMRNFDNQDAFVQSISIQDANSILKETKATDTTFEISIFPEGGNYVVNAPVNFGFKIADAYGRPGKGAKGSIVNGKGISILNTISTNVHGIGNFRILPEEGSSYSLVLELEDGTTIIENLPTPEPLGLNLSINNLFDDKISISISTNTESFKQFHDKEFYIALHKDGNLVLSSFVLKEKEVNVQIQKQKLLPGLYTLTLFSDAFKPLSERLLFNENNFSDRLLSIDTITASQKPDSLQLRLQMEQPRASTAYLSVSVLPLQTRANQLHTSILSSFLIEPYVKGPIPNLKYYLSEPDRKSYFELDQLLLTQGWGRDDWESIFYEPPQEWLDYETGIDITGKVLNAKYGASNQISLYPTSLNRLKFAEVTSNKDFSFENLQLFKGEDIHFTLINEKGSTLKPKLLSDFSSFDITDDGLGRSMPKGLPSAFEPLESFENENIEEFFINERVTQLDEATVYARKVKELPTQNPSLLVGIFEAVKITEENVKRHATLSSFVRSLGFKTSNDFVLNEFSILPKIAIKSSPVVILNGFKTQEAITDFTLNSVDEVYYEHAGTHGSNGGTIYIYRKNGSLVGQKPVERFAKILAEGGFNRPEKYNNPYYSSYSSTPFQQFGAVHWQAQVTTNLQGTASFTIPDYGLTEYRIFIEGMDANGNLISSVKDIILQ